MSERRMDEKKYNKTQLKIQNISDPLQLSEGDDVPFYRHVRFKTVDIPYEFMWIQDFVMRKDRQQHPFVTERSNE